MPITRTTRNAIALMGLAASLALPIAAQAHAAGDHGRPATQVAGDRGAGAASDARPSRGAAAHAAKQKGPSAAQLAAKLNLERGTVRAAMRAAHEHVRDVVDRDARKAAFEAAVATQLGLPAETVGAAFTAVRADDLTQCVDRLVTRGVLTDEQAAAIDAKISAGDLDGAHGDIRAAKAAAADARRA